MTTLKLSEEFIKKRNELTERYNTYIKRQNDPKFNNEMLHSELAAAKTNYSILQKEFSEFKIKTEGHIKY